MLTSLSAGPLGRQGWRWPAGGGWGRSPRSLEGHLVPNPSLFPFSWVGNEHGVWSRLNWKVGLTGATSQWCDLRQVPRPLWTKQSPTPTPTPLKSGKDGGMSCSQCPQGPKPSLDLMAHTGTGAGGNIQGLRILEQEAGSRIKLQRGLSFPLRTHRGPLRGRSPAGLEQGGAGPRFRGPFLAPAWEESSCCQAHVTRSDHSNKKNGSRPTALPL